jgi:16S rRNA (guanine527-N7)-methyltransferase
MSLNLEEGLRSGVKALNLNLLDEQVQRLLDYMALIQKWNKVYNLTALRDPADMLTHHLLDSLTAIAPLSRHTKASPSRCSMWVRVVVCRAWSWPFACPS